MGYPFLRQRGMGCGCWERVEKRQKGGKVRLLFAGRKRCGAQGSGNGTSVPEAPSPLCRCGRNRQMQEGEGGTGMG